MVKLSQQLKGDRLTRTKRVSQEQQEERFEKKKAKREELKKKVEKAKKELSSIKTIEEYESKYNKLPEDVKPFFDTPKKLQSKPQFQEYEKKYQEQQKKKREFSIYKNWLSKAKKTQKKYGFFSTTIPEELIGTQYERPLKSMIENQRISMSTKEYQRQFKEGETKLKDIPPYYQRKFEFETPQGEELSTEEALELEKKQIEFEKQKELDIKAKKQTPFYYSPKNTGIIEVDKGELPLGYGGQQTRILDSEGQVTTPRVYMTDEQFFREPQSPLNINLTKVISSIGKGIDWVEDEAISTLAVGFGKVYSVNPLIDLELTKEEAKSTKKEIESRTSDKLSTASSAITSYGRGGRKREEEEIEQAMKFHSTIASGVFQREYGLKVASGELTSEEAKEEFLKSDEYKAIEESAGETASKRLANLDKETSFFSKRGATAFGLQSFVSLQKFSTKTFSSPTRAGLTAGALNIGVEALKVAPNYIIYPATTYSLGSGISKAIDSDSSYMEQGAGIVQAGISSAILTGGAIKWARTGRVFRKPIEKPTLDLKSGEIIGYTQKGGKVKLSLGSTGKLTAKGLPKDVSLLKIPKAQIGLYSVGGSRPIVTTNFRLLVNKGWRALGVPKKFANLESNAVYRGIPSLQPAKYVTFKSLRGTYKIKVSPSGYEKASKVLSRSGASPKDITKALRYTAPKIYKQYVDGKLFIKGGRAIGSVSSTLKQPRVLVDKDLRIYTRARGDIVKTFDIERYATSGKSFLELKTEIITKKALGGRIISIETGNVEASRVLVKTGNIEKGYLGFNKGKLDINFPANYQKLSPIEITSNIDKQIINLRRTRDTLLFKNLRKEKTFGKSYFKGKKTPWRSTKKYDTVDDLISNLDDVKPIKNKDFKKVLSRLNDKFIPSSKYAGTGQYELTRGGTSVYTPKTTTEQSILGKVTSPNFNIKSPSVANLFKPITNIKPINALALGLLSDTPPKQDLKTAIKLRISNLASDKVFSEDKVDTKVSPRIRSITKISSSTKTPTKSLLDTPPIVTPNFRTPTTTKIEPPVKNIPFSFPFPQSSLVKKSKIKRQKKITELAYLPDFTSRSLGLKPQKITEKQARKKLNKILTGLEIRRGVKIKT